MTGRQRILLGVTVDHAVPYHKDLAMALAEAGQSVHMVSTDGPHLRALGKHVVVHVLPMARAPHPTKDVAAFCQWMSLLRAVRPHTVMIGTPKAGLLGLLAARILKIPRRIYFVHGLRYEAASGASMKLLMYVERLTIRCASDVVAVSPSVRTRLLNDRMASDRKIAVIGHGSAQGVDLEVFRPPRSESERLELTTELDLDPAVPTVGFLGRLTPDKGLREFADAAAQLAQMRICFQILLVGPVDGKDGSRMVERIRQSGVRCRATGFTSDPAKYLRAMDILCFPTHREGLGNAILEAFATRVPVVSTRVTGVVDLVTDEDTGLLIEPYDSEQLAAAIERLLAEPGLNLRLARNAHTFVRSRYAKEQVLEAQLQFLLATQSVGQTR